MAEERHVVLAKPGDVLLIGNVGQIDQELLQAASGMFNELQIKVFWFAADIEIGKGEY